MATVLITGGTGTIGQRLSAMLVQNGYDVIILTRDATQAKAFTPGIVYAGWNIDKSKIDILAIKKADYIVHLAGANVAGGRWTEKRKKEIVESRTKSSLLLVKTLSANDNKIKAVISATATGWYGEDTAETLLYGFNEGAQASNDFLGETCRLWEESVAPVTGLGKRLVKLRTGIVLSNHGGAYVEFKKPLKAGVAGILGTGRQMVSWVHVDDICRMYIYAIENERMQGAYNAVAPNPVSNKTLALSIAKQLNPRFYIPMHVPAFALRLALGEMSIEVLKSVTASAGKIIKTGFRFLYPTIDAAVKALANEKS
jgi:uncharacterized protein (TIGR01777 family)